jgi:hypothetical protein
MDNASRCPTPLPLQPYSVNDDHYRLRIWIVRKPGAAAGSWHIAPWEMRALERAQRTILAEFRAAIDPSAADVGDHRALGIHHYNWHRSHESLHGDNPSSGCVSGQTRRTSGPQVVRPMILRQSTSRSAMTPVR